MIDLSIVIPTHNNEKILKLSLLALDKQTYPHDKFEVIIVDDGSKTKTVRSIKEFIPRLTFNVSIFVQKHKGPASARNLGIKKAGGEINLIINDDTIATPKLIEKHLSFHKKYPSENFGLLGYVTWHPDLEITPFMYWLEHGGPYFSFSEIKGKIAGWERFWTCNISLKKNFFLKEGLFDENFPSASWEDVELGYRLGKKGLKLFYEKEALGYHFHPTTINSIREKMRNNGKCAMLLKGKIPKSSLPPLAKTPITELALILDTIFSPLIFFLEKIALWGENRLNMGIIFNLVLLHYRIEGLRKN